jgi:hypothetical protein
MPLDRPGNPWNFPDVPWNSPDMPGSLPDISCGSLDMPWNLPYMLGKSAGVSGKPPCLPESFVALPATGLLWEMATKWHESARIRMGEIDWR